ncbi:unnamed protein product [Sphenostylis stenocarpa]|uniref:Uncharacterized protein n=1 Tax=Sphenostylis stenocarpa TaxID=92480 RepID=A0AA86SM29_9FABA|nr:unnamed protein product [Sphenostylis stenocarpa]
MIADIGFRACDSKDEWVGLSIMCRAVVDRSAIPRFPSVQAIDKHVMKNNSATKSTILDQELAQKWVVPRHPLKPIFSKVIQVVVFETL